MTGHISCYLHNEEQTCQEREYVVNRKIDINQVKHMGMKEQFCKKIYDELQEYKRASDVKNADDMDGCKGEMLDAVYNILIMAADDFSEALLMKLINQSTSILESIYQKFEEHPDTGSFYMDVKEHVEQSAGNSGKRVFYDMGENDGEDEGIGMEEDGYAWWDNSTYKEGGC